MIIHLTIRATIIAFMTGIILSGCAYDNGPALTQNHSTVIEPTSVADDVCDAIDRPAISSRAYALNRPDDFYALCYTRDESVCATAYEYLNEFPQPKAENWLDKGVFQAIGARFWKERTTIPWRGDVVNAAKLDIFNDGNIYAVFQTRIGFGGIKIPTLFVSNPYANPDDIILDFELFRSTRTTDLESQYGSIYPLNLRPMFSRRTSRVNASVAQINNHNYLAFFTPSIPLAVGEVMIVDMSDRKTGELICKFQARYKISKNQ